jgi:thiol-disulfide isomerase/thioredoxin
MKNIILLTMMLTGYYGSAQTNFSITGNIPPKLDVKKVYLTYRLEGKDYQDSSGIVNDTYSFKGSIPEATLVHLAAGYNKETEFKFSRDVAGLYIEASDITVNHLDSFSQTTVQGSKSQDTYLKMKVRLKKSNDELLRLGEQYNQYMTEGKKEEVKKTVAEIDKIMIYQRSILQDLFLENISSPFAIHILTSYDYTGAEPEKVDSLFAMLEPKARSGPTGIKLSAKLDKQKRLGIGRVAPEFTQADTAGIPVSLSSFRGKYILIDFWASWCGPCRDENPYVVKAFNTYKDKGFHVLSVSLDKKDSRGKWLKAIHDDHLNWTHVSDLQYWDNAVALQYSIESIPQNFLLDPIGKIIAKNLRAEALEKALEEIYK